MRSALPLLPLALLLAPALAHAPTEDPLEPARLLGRERFVWQLDARDHDQPAEGLTRDAGPLGHAGRTHLVAAAEGRHGGALHFPNPDPRQGGENASYLAVDAPAFGKEPPFTFLAWVKLDPGSRGGPLVDAFEPNSDVGRVFGWNLSIHPGRLEGTLSKNGTIEERPFGAGAAVREGEWVHVAFVLEPSRLRLYVNGSLILAEDVPDPVAEVNETVFVGAKGDVICYPCPLTFYDGLRATLDEVRLHDRALTREEIGSLMERPYEERPPCAAFRASPAPAQTGATVTFEDASSDPGGRPLVAWHWELGDGTTATGPAPTHAYARAGRYPVNLTVTASDGASSRASHEIVVKDDVAPPFLVLERPRAGHAYVAGFDLGAGSSTRENATVHGGLTVRANASDAQSGLREVRFLVDGRLRSTSHGSPHEWTWPTHLEAWGTRRLTVEAEDRDGNVATASVAVDVLLGTG